MFTLMSIYQILERLWIDIPQSEKSQELKKIADKISLLVFI